MSASFHSFLSLYNKYLSYLFVYGFLFCIYLLEIKYFQYLFLEYFTEYLQKLNVDSHLSKHTQGTRELAHQLKALGPCGS